jgi:hypothetical protein
LTPKHEQRHCFGCENIHYLIIASKSTDFTVIRR